MCACVFVYACVMDDDPLRPQNAFLETFSFLNEGGVIAYVERNKFNCEEGITSVCLWGVVAFMEENHNCIFKLKIRR